MSDKPDGGQAFPYTYPSDPGMTLRDYFATHSDVSDYELHDFGQLCALAGEPEPDRTAADYTLRIIDVSTKAAAKLRYMLADAMLAERQK